MILVILFFGVLIGVVLGSWWMSYADQSSFKKRWWMPIIFLMLLGCSWRDKIAPNTICIDQLDNVYHGYKLKGSVKYESNRVISSRDLQRLQSAKVGSSSSGSREGDRSTNRRYK